MTRTFPITIIHVFSLHSLIRKYFLVIIDHISYKFKWFLPETVLIALSKATRTISPELILLLPIRAVVKLNLGFMMVAWTSMQVQFGFSSLYNLVIIYAWIYGCTAHSYRQSSMNYPITSNICWLYTVYDRIISFEVGLAVFTHAHSITAPSSLFALPTPTEDFSSFFFAARTERLNIHGRSDPQLKVAGQACQMGTLTAEYADLRLWKLVLNFKFLE